MVSCCILFSIPFLTVNELNIYIFTKIPNLFKKKQKINTMHTLLVERLRTEGILT